MSETRELTRGEKIAIAAGKEVSTKEQFALCYLVAKGQSKKIRGLGVSENFALESGMKPETYRRAVAKFKLIIEDKHEDDTETAKETIYDKILTYYKVFYEMSIDQLLELAKGSFTEDAKLQGKVYYDHHLANATTAAAKQKEKRSKLETDILLYVGDYAKVFQSRGQSIHEARKKAKHMAAKKFEKKISEVNRICDYD